MSEENRAIPGEAILALATMVVPRGSVETVCKISSELATSLDSYCAVR